MGPAARALIGVGALAHLIREIPSASVGTSGGKICRLIRGSRDRLARVLFTFASVLNQSNGRMKGDPKDWRDFRT